MISLSAPPPTPLTPPHPPPPPQLNKGACKDGHITTVSSFTYRKHGNCLEHKDNHLHIRFSHCIQYHLHIWFSQCIQYLSDALHYSFYTYIWITVFIISKNVSAQLHRCICFSYCSQYLFNALSNFTYMHVFMCPFTVLSRSVYRYVLVTQLTVFNVHPVPWKTASTCVF